MSIGISLDKLNLTSLLDKSELDESKSVFGPKNTDKKNLIGSLKLPVLIGTNDFFKERFLGITVTEEKWLEEVKNEVEQSYDREFSKPTPLMTPNEKKIEIPELPKTEEKALKADKLGRITDMFEEEESDSEEKFVFKTEEPKKKEIPIEKVTEILPKQKLTMFDSEDEDEPFTKEEPKATLFMKEKKEETVEVNKAEKKRTLFDSDEEELPEKQEKKVEVQAKKPKLTMFDSDEEQEDVKETKSAIKLAMFDSDDEKESKNNGNTAKVENVETLIVKDLPKEGRKTNTENLDKRDLTKEFENLSVKSKNKEELGLQASIKRDLDNTEKSRKESDNSNEKQGKRKLSGNSKVSNKFKDVHSKLVGIDLRKSYGEVRKEGETVVSKEAKSTFLKPKGNKKLKPKAALFDDSSEEETKERKEIVKENVKKVEFHFDD